MEQHVGDLLDDDFCDPRLSSLPAGDWDFKENLDFDEKFSVGSSCNSVETKARGDLNENTDGETAANTVMRTDISDSESIATFEVGPDKDCMSSDGDSEQKDVDKGAAKLFVAGDFKFRESSKEDTVCTKLQLPTVVINNELVSISAKDLESSTCDEMFDEIAQEIEKIYDHHKITTIDGMTVAQEETTLSDDSDESDVESEDSEASSTDEDSEEGGSSSDDEVKWKDEGATVQDEVCGDYKEIKDLIEKQLSVTEKVEDPQDPSPCVKDSDFEKTAFDNNRSGLDVKPEHDEESAEEDTGAAKLFVSDDFVLSKDFKEDEFLAEGRSSAQESVRNPQVRNKAQSASECVEEASYFKTVAGCDSEKMMKGDEIEEDEKYEKVSVTKPVEYHFFTHCDEVGRHVTVDGLHLAEHSQGLMANGEVNDFVGEDFQEAGERYSDLASDFSAHVEIEANMCVVEEGRTDLCNVYLEMNKGKFTSSAVDEVEVNEGYCCSSSDDESHVTSDKFSDDDSLVNEQHPGGNFSHDDIRSEPSFNIAYDLNISSREELMTTDMLGPSDSFRIHYAAADVMVQKSSRTTISTDQGSLDDSFFFNTGLEEPGKTALEKLDDNEEERNWEQEQERIKAFYKFYDSSDEDNGPERMIKVQFSAEPLSQVIHYETDSGSESLRSSSEDDNDQSFAKTSDEQMDSDTTIQQTPVLMNAKVQEQKPDLKTKSGWKHKCFNILRLVLRMSLVVSVGLLVLWFAVEHLRMLQPYSLL